MFPVSERSMHFNSNPLQVDLSQSHGPERVEKGRDREGGGRGYWWEMGHEAHHHVAQSSSFGSLCFCHIVVLNVGPYSKRRRLTHELKASKFLSFHILVASLVFNRSQRSQKRQRWQEGERGGGKEGRVEREIEEDGKKTSLAQWVGSDA